MLKIRIKQIKAIVLVSLFSLLSLFLKRQSWVLCERGTDARDNGYHFYKYLENHHPEIKVYYIVDKKSADYEKVKKNAIQYGSIRNYWVVATARKIISTHYALCLPNIGSKIFTAIGLDKKFYFLQHGVVYNNLNFLHFKNAPMNLFCCGAKPEYEFIKNTFGHPEGVVRYTGLARYDNLHGHITTNDILVMPTWRMYLSGLSNEEFMRSDYYIHWSEVLNNPQLSAMLQEHDLRLVFYPHYEMQKFVDCFKIENDNVVVANFDDYDVQKLLIDAKLLITDYSSVFFDFAYMEKPCIYYQFDKAEFYSQHYKQGYFDYSKNGFGEVAINIEELIGAVKKSLDFNFALETIYSERINGFFELHDDHNCERIYEAIEALK